MRINSNYVLRTIGEKNIVVPLGDNSSKLNGIIELSDSGAFLWNLLNNDQTEDSLLSSLLGEYDVDEVTAKEDVSAFINQLKESNILE